MSQPQEYKPGEKVQRSGIYRVTHDTVHQDVHEATCVAGELFPPCNHCGAHPRFVLVRAALHLSLHQHFKKGQLR